MTNISIEGRNLCKSNNKASVKSRLYIQFLDTVGPKNKTRNSDGGCVFADVTIIHGDS